MKEKCRVEPEEDVLNQPTASLSSAADFGEQLSHKDTRTEADGIVGN